MILIVVIRWLSDRFGTCITNYYIFLTGLLSYENYTGCHWVSLRGKPATSNTKSIKISIPRHNQFTVFALQAIMQRLALGELP
ncbi:MAG: DUF4365 domain-containing protein [Pseudanabaena sp.]